MANLKTINLPTGQRAFIPKRGYGMIYYPSLPQPLQGTKQAHRPDFDITHPEDWPEWVQNLHSEHATVEVTKDGKVIWWGGTVHDGIWMGGYWMGGCWRDGIWLDGDWINGHWITGEWRGGNFRKGYWEDGIFRAGSFAGVWLGGLWLGGEFRGYKDRTDITPGYIVPRAKW